MKVLKVKSMQQVCPTGKWKGALHGYSPIQLTKGYHYTPVSTGNMEETENTKHW